jgi:REP element-mobilizing transposase RayT
MSSTHLDLNYHLVFSTKIRHPWIKQSWAPRLYSYLGGILRENDGVAGAIGGSPDHVHLLAGLKASRSLSEIMRDLKSDSSSWIHRTIDGCRRFQWQDGYGAFTVGRGEIELVRAYINDQKEHHRKKTFQEEYVALLKASGVNFDERYLW